MFKLPIEIDIDNQMQQLLLEASNNLSELNGLHLVLPNETIILNALTLTEAKESSAIENIFTTYDELFKEIANIDENNLAAKEVMRYRTSLLTGIKKINDSPTLKLHLINDIHDMIHPEHKGIREFDGKNRVVIKNSRTHEIIHTPPQDKKEVLEYLDNLFHYIWKKDNLHPLIKMPIIHLQFERIHPYRDGNGRTGRILNILYLLWTKVLKSPSFYLSKYIIENKREYYDLLQKAGENPKRINDLIKYMLRAVSITATRTKNYILAINNLINETKNEIKTKLPKIYSHELVELLFFDLYTRPKFLVEKLKITRKTADKYLKLLVQTNYLDTKKIGREVIFINKKFDTIIDMIDG